MRELEKIAAILQKMSTLPSLGKKKVQKLMYLIERKGVDLSLDYTIHFYGPYSERLNEALHALEDQGIIRINSTGSTHLIEVREETDVAAIADDLTIITQVLDSLGEKTALDLEAITTLDYAAVFLLPKQASNSDIIREVKRIKGNKFSQTQLENDLQLLHSQNYLPEPVL